MSPTKTPSTLKLEDATLPSKETSKHTTIGLIYCMFSQHQFRSFGKILVFMCHIFTYFVWAIGAIDIHHQVPIHIPLFFIIRQFLTFVNDILNTRSAFMAIILLKLYCKIHFSYFLLRTELELSILKKFTKRLTFYNIDNPLTFLLDSLYDKIFLKAASSTM